MPGVGRGDPGDLRRGRLPGDAYQTILATNDQIADAIADPRVRGVSVTGSERAGAAVAEIAGRNLKKVVLEMGGSDPFILLATDDLDEAVEAAANARLDNTGQSCNAAKRFIVADDLYDDFLAKLTEKMGSTEPGDPTTDPAMGPLSSDDGRRAAGRTSSIGRSRREPRSRSKGERKDNFFTPTVLTGITPDNDAYHEEFFGPVASVYKVGSEEEAVELANDTPFGLGSYVFTDDRRAGAARRGPPRHRDGLRQRDAASTARSSPSAGSSAPASAASSAPTGWTSSSTRS